MLEKADIELMRTLMQETVETAIQSFQKELKETGTELKSEIQDVRTELKSEIQDVRTDLRETENTILEEIDRTREILEKEIDVVRKNVEDLEKYYRITRLENDNTTILLKIIEDVQKRLTELEKKTA